MEKKLRAFQVKFKKMIIAQKRPSKMAIIARGK